MAKFKIEPHDHADKSFAIYNDKITMNVDYDDVNHIEVDTEALRIIGILNQERPTAKAPVLGAPYDLTPAKRYVIRGDDSGHKFFIEVEQEKNFYLWVESFTADCSEYNGPSFDRNRIDGTFTFTDPRCE